MAPSKDDWAAVVASRGRSESQAVSILPQASRVWDQCQMSPWASHAEVGWRLEHRCWTGSPLILPYSSSVPPVDQLAPCTAIPAAVRIRPGLDPSLTKGGRSWGCDERCGSRCDRAQSSMSAELLSRFAATSRQRSVHLAYNPRNIHLALEVHRCGAGQEGLIVGLLGCVCAHCVEHSQRSEW